MDWPVKSLAKASLISGRLFEPGDQVLSYLYQDDEAALQRADLSAQEKTAFTPQGDLIGWWAQVIKEEETAPTQAEITQSLEEHFLALYHAQEENNAQAQADNRQRDSQKALLALALERKRVLKPMGSARSGTAQRYQHIKTKEVFLVPAVDLNALVGEDLPGLW